MSDQTPSPIRTRTMRTVGEARAPARSVPFMLECAGLPRARGAGPRSRIRGSCSPGRAASCHRRRRPTWRARPRAATSRSGAPRLPSGEARGWSWSPFGSPSPTATARTRRSIEAIPSAGAPFAPSGTERRELGPSKRSRRPPTDDPGRTLCVRHGKGDHASPHRGGHETGMGHRGIDVDEHGER